MLAVGCQPPPNATSVPVVDLVRELDRAVKQPPNGFAIATHEKDDVVRAAIAVTVPSRLTIPLALPRHGVLRASVTLETEDPAAAVRFRIGVSDHRIYEGVNAIVVTGDRRGWVDLRANLSAYAGFKWSLFYRPDRVIWRVVMATELVQGSAARGVWGTPEIVTDTESAREYEVRRRRLPG